MCFGQGKENLGMVMIFTLVSAGQEWLNEKWDYIKKEQEERLMAKQKADEEAEMVTDLILYFALANIFTILCPKRDNSLNESEPSPCIKLNQSHMSSYKLSFFCKI